MTNRIRGHKAWLTLTSLYDYIYMGPCPPHPRGLWVTTLSQRLFLSKAQGTRCIWEFVLVCVTEGRMWQSLKCWTLGLDPKTPETRPSRTTWKTSGVELPLCSLAVQVLFWFCTLGSVRALNVWAKTLGFQILIMKVSIVVSLKWRCSCSEILNKCQLFARCVSQVRCPMLKALHT